MKRIKVVNFILILGFILLTVFYFVGLPYFFEESWSIGLWILGSTTFISLILFLILLSEDNKYLRKELKKEFYYIFHDSTVAWTIGLLLGSLIASFVLIAFGIFKYTHAEVNPSAFDIVSIYVGSVLGVLAIRAFYKSLHPIYDELELIKMLTIDFSTIKPNDKIWFSFPAFNLYHFRSQTNPRKIGTNEFTEFVEELNAKIGTSDYEFNGVCYS